jgi:hypothetical protein
MKFVFLFFTSIVFVVGCSHKNSSTAVNKPVQKEWVRLSDEIATRYSLATSEFSPEGGSWLGYTQFDALATPLDNEYSKRSNALSEKWVLILNDEEKKTYPVETKEDIRILRSNVQREILGYQLGQQFAMIDFNGATKNVFVSIQSLVNPQVSAARQLKAVDRFRAYVNGSNKYKPFLVASQEYYLAMVKEFAGKDILYPPKSEVELYLKESPQYIAGIEQLLKESGRADWKDLYETFKKQAVVYDAFVKNEILPKARLSPRVPKEIYALRLKSMGIEVSPEELIQLGESGYKELYPQYEALAKKLAKKYKIKSSKPADVVAYFKKKQIVKAEDLQKLYYAADARLKVIVEKNQIVTLPEVPLAIRMAGEAESLAVPVPHLNPPRFVGNQGERPEFVVPTAKDKMPFDDFSHEFAAIGVTAHEGRPGHDLQFSRMLEVGMTTIRAVYAMNSVNVEGWALYAEDLVYPYIKDEEKFFGLQMRLWRMARMFLDPQIQLGLIKDQRVMDVFTKELGVSREMASLELRRYTIQAPGQAPAYYYGYLMVKKALAEAEKAQGAQFNLKCFNDQVLSYGLLPLPMVLEKVKESKGAGCMNQTSL